MSCFYGQPVLGYDVYWSCPFTLTPISYNSNPRLLNSFSLRTYPPRIMYDTPTEYSFLSYLYISLRIHLVLSQECTLLARWRNFAATTAVERIVVCLPLKSCLRGNDIRYYFSIWRFLLVWIPLSKLHPSRSSRITGRIAQGPMRGPITCYLLWIISTWSNQTTIR